MKGSKKRKADEPENGESISILSDEELKVLLEPLRKDQLIALLAKLGTQYPYVAEEIRGVASADPVHRKLFVRGLSWETTSETLRAAFQIHGEIEEGAVVIDIATGKSRGYGFITYQDIESTKRALKEPSKLIDGRMAVCNLACEGLSSTSVNTDVAQRKLYIGGLSPEISSATLLNFFNRHGEIEEGSVAYHKDTNKSRGFGFVTYKTVEAAEKALDDPDKILGEMRFRKSLMLDKDEGRNITVKLADSHKIRLPQAHIPATVVPIPVPVPTAFVHPGKTHANASSLGYASYSQPLNYPSLYAQAFSQYPPHTQVQYPHGGMDTDFFGVPSAAPSGASGHPYYNGGL